MTFPGKCLGNQELNYYSMKTEITPPCIPYKECQLLTSICSFSNTWSRDFSQDSTDKIYNSSSSCKKYQIALERIQCTFTNSTAAAGAVVCTVHTQTHAHLLLFPFSQHNAWLSSALFGLFFFHPQ